MKATITLHGSKYDKQLPSVGSKNIAIIGGQLNILGKPNTKPTWTRLK